MDVGLLYPSLPMCAYVHVQPAVNAQAQGCAGVRSCIPKGFPARLRPRMLASRFLYRFAKAGYTFTSPRTAPSGRQVGLFATAVAGRRVGCLYRWGNVCTRRLHTGVRAPHPHLMIADRECATGASPWQQGSVFTAGFSLCCAMLCCAGVHTG